MKVWVVHFVDEFDQYVFSSAEKAYNCILGSIKEHFDEDDGVDEIIKELDADYVYANDHSYFGVEGYACAEMEMVDEYC